LCTALKKSSASYYSTDARPVADTVNANKFYALDGSRLLISTNAGASFAAAGNLPASKGFKVIRAAPGREGDIWVPLYDGGLARSTDSRTTFANIAHVSYAAAVGFGKAAAGASYPIVYLWGTIGGVRGLFRSTDTGANWGRVDDDATNMAVRAMASL
jgi:hypothetical protein